jgi:hypothetical protein
MKLLHGIFRLQYSNERIGAAIGDIWIIKCALYCTIRAKYRTHRLVYAVKTVIPYIYNVFTAPHIQASTFIEGICADFGDIATIQCALYCNLGAKYSSQPPAGTM